MHLHYLRYAVEVARCRSITKAAAKLFISQPNLSRAIRELEEEFGAPIFQRTPAGMLPTVQGEAFLSHAQTVLQQMEEIRLLGHPEQGEHRLVLNLSVPRASYIAHAFTETIAAARDSQKICINYFESNSMQAIGNIHSGVSSLAIVRFTLESRSVMETMLRGAGLDFRPVMDFTPVVLLSRRHPLASQPSITREMLRDSIEILHGDPFIPSLSPILHGQASPTPEFSSERSIRIYERGSQFDLLRDVPSTFMWVSPMPRRQLDCNELVQLRCSDLSIRYRDILICRKGHRFTAAERSFIDRLEQSIQQVLALIGEDPNVPYQK